MSMDRILNPDAYLEKLVEEEGAEDDVDTDDEDLTLADSRSRGGASKSKGDARSKKSGADGKSFNDDWLTNPTRPRSLLDKGSGKVSVKASTVRTTTRLDRFLPRCDYSRAELVRIRDVPLLQLGTTAERSVRKLLAKYNDKVSRGLSVTSTSFVLVLFMVSFKLWISFEVNAHE